MKFTAPALFFLLFFFFCRKMCAILKLAIVLSPSASGLHVKLSAVKRAPFPSSPFWFKQLAQPIPPAPTASTFNTNWSLVYDCQIFGMYIYVRGKERPFKLCGISAASFFLIGWNTPSPHQHLSDLEMPRNQIWTFSFTLNKPSAPAPLRQNSLKNSFHVEMDLRHAWYVNTFSIPAVCGHFAYCISAQLVTKVFRILF